MFKYIQLNFEFRGLFNSLQNLLHTEYNTNKVTDRKLRSTIWKKGSEFIQDSKFSSLNIKNLWPELIFSICNLEMVLLIRELSSWVGYKIHVSAIKTLTLLSVSILVQITIQQYISRECICMSLCGSVSNL